MKLATNILIENTNGAYKLDTSVTAEDGAKIMIYAMQLIEYRRAHPETLVVKTQPPTATESPSDKPNPKNKK